jgi:hypothetical protein
MLGFLAGGTAGLVLSAVTELYLRFQAVYDGMLAVVATIGLVWAVRRWRAYQIDRWRAAHTRPAEIDPATAQPA